MENLKYPIGKFDKSKDYSNRDIEEALEYLNRFPDILDNTLKGVSEKDLENIYRPDGWNVRQIVHHLADSHANMYIRVKLALDEDNPTISGYNEANWANMSDNEVDISYSQMMVKGIHARLNKLLGFGFDPERTYYHPGYKSTYKLGTVVNLYAWHSKHHLEHIKIALKK